MIVYIVLIPLLSSLLTPILGLINRKTGFFVTLINAILTFTIIIYSTRKVYIYGPERYFFGGFEPPYGIEYVLDGLNSVIILIIAFIYLLSVLYSKKSLEKEIEQKRISLFYCIMNLYFTGILGIAITGDIFNLYVFIEIASLSAYTLIAMGLKRESLMASYNYLIIGTIGATFVLIGIGYIFMATGSLNMADLKLRLPSLYHSKMVRTGFTFLTLGLMLKLALFPLHIWLPNAYTYSPSTISALLAGTGTKVSAYALIRILYSVFTIDFDVNIIPFSKIFIFLSLIAIVMGSLLALAQKNLKKMLAYSSIGQIGYITLGISLANESALQGSIIHIFNHSLMKTALFFIAGGFFYKQGIENIQDLKGIARKMPLTMSLFIIAGLSLVGVPFTAGFISKWYIVIGAVESKYYIVIPVILLSSILSLVYIWRVLEISYFGESNGNEHKEELPVPLFFPAMISSVLCIFFGIYTELPVELSKRAIEILWGY
ncbi:MAG: monovalent cation/H+ antiporter subunit D family protein [Proteobacteria bacterium]|nr:monovalent cation/H+ antiporter subunit D family protein [Pseudomonadota bacterium]